MADASIPHFKTYAEGEPIPPVDPEDIKRKWEFERTHSRVGIDGWKLLQDLQAALSPGADIPAVSHRCEMIRTLTHFNLLAPWQHGEELDETAFRIAATFPIRELSHRNYMIPGDEYFGFDPNAFVQRLIEVTGVSHVWEPVATKISEGGRCYITASVNFKGQVPGQVPDQEREAKRRARDLVWEIWSRFANLDRLLSHTNEQAFSDKEAFHLVTILFDDFVGDNTNLLREVESAFRSGSGMPPLATLTELERKAQGGV